MADSEQNGWISRVTHRDELRLQALVSEAASLRRVQVQLESNQRQILVLALASASAAFPLLLTQADKFPPLILGEILYALAVIYSGMALAYVSDIYNISHIGKFIREQSDPEIDRIVRREPSASVPHWESFLIPSTFVVVPNLLEMGSLATLVLLLLPGVMSLASAAYVVTLQPSAAVANVVVPGILVALFAPLRAVAWIVFVLAVLAQVAAVPWGLILRGLRRRRRT